MTAPARRYDPFAPAPAGFPERRLRRAGLDDASLGSLRTRFDEMGAAERAELARFVARNPDPVIRERFAAGRTREELEALHVDDLQDLLRERPGGLSTTGRKAELIDRLLASYSGSVPAPAAVPDDGDDDTAATAPTAEPTDNARPATIVGAPAPEPQTPDAAPAPATEEDTRG